MILLKPSAVLLYNNNYKTHTHTFFYSCSFICISYFIWVSVQGLSSFMFSCISVNWRYDVFKSRQRSYKPAVNRGSSTWSLDTTQALVENQLQGETVGEIDGSCGWRFSCDRSLFNKTCSDGYHWLRGCRWTNTERRVKTEPKAGEPIRTIVTKDILRK